MVFAIGLIRPTARAGVNKTLYIPLTRKNNWTAVVFFSFLSFGTYEWRRIDADDEIHMNQ